MRGSTREILQKVFDDAGNTLRTGVSAALPAGTNTIGKLAANSGVDIGDVDVLSIAAGANIIGSTMDAGPSQTITRTFTASADMTSAADLTAAPTAGQKLAIMDIIVSSDTIMDFSFEEETSSTVLLQVFLAANSTVSLHLRGLLKTVVADKKLLGKASVAGNVAITMIYFSEA